MTRIIRRSSASDQFSEFVAKDMEKISSPSGGRIEEFWVHSSSNSGVNDSPVEDKEIFSSSVDNIGIDDVPIIVRNHK